MIGSLSYVEEFWIVSVWALSMVIAACMFRPKIWDWLNNEAPIFYQVLQKILLLEIIGVLGAYTLFHKMNSSEDFRHKMKRRWPSILEVYYKSNEWAGVYGIRETDEEKWLTKKP